MSPVRLPSPAAIGLGGLLVGVAIGLVAPGAIAGAVGVAGGVAGLVARRRRPAAFVLIVAFGVLHGAAARAPDRRSCAARLPEGPIAVLARLEDPATPGELATATMPGCRGRLLVRAIGPDTLWAGDRVRLEGRWLPRPSRAGPTGGLLAVRGSELVERSPGSIDRLRNRALRLIGELFGARAGVVRALILGNRGTIDPAVAEGFSRTGLVHLLSISGFHVGLIWAWVLLLAGLLGWQRRAEAIAAVVVAGYVGFIGAPPPAARATLLSLVGAIERSRQRAPATGPLFAVVATLVVALDPWAIADLGAWLSVTALWGATAASRWSDRAIGPSAAARLLAASAGATLFTGPLTALVFGSVPVIGVLLNLIAIPLAALAVPAVAAALLLGGASAALGAAFASGGGGLLAVLEWIAHHGARIPGAALTFEPGPLGAGVAAATLGAAVWVFGRRHRPREALRRLGWLGAVAFAARGAAIGLGRGDAGSGLTLHFLDVGQGDAALLETPRGRWILIDAGPSDDRSDAGRRVIVPFLRRRGVRALEAAVVSHGHRDHFGGLESVIAAMPVRRVLEPGRLVADREYASLLERIGAGAIPWLPLRAGGRIEIDGVTLEALHPDSAWSGWTDDLNEDSIVLLLRSGRFEALLTGDAGMPAERHLVGRVPPVELLKVGHHGSRGATGAAWLAALAPRLAVVSVGRNGYGHPAPETLERLARAGVPVWRTDRDGAVTVRIGPDRVTVGGGRSGREAEYPIQ